MGHSGAVAPSAAIDKGPQLKVYEARFSEGPPPSVRHLGKGSRIRDKMNEEERAVMARER